MKLTKDRVRVYFECTQASQKRRERFLHSILTKGSKLWRGDQHRKRGWASRGGIAGRWICRVNSWKIRALLLRFVCAESSLCHLSFPSEEGCSLSGMAERRPTPSRGEVEALLLAESGGQRLLFLTCLHCKVSQRPSGIF